jgi:hypothetical protein
MTTETMSGKEPSNDIFFTWLSRLSTVFMFWFFGCVFWTLNEVIDHNDALKDKETELFKNECISREGSIRHDRWMFGVDVYCAEKSGLEVLYKISDDGRLFSPSVMTNLFFGMYDFEDYFRSTLPEAMKTTKSVTGE